MTNVSQIELHKVYKDTFGNFIQYGPDELPYSILVSRDIATDFVQNWYSGAARPLVFLSTLRGLDEAHGFKRKKVPPFDSDNDRYWSQYAETAFSLQLPYFIGRKSEATLSLYARGSLDPRTFVSKVGGRWGNEAEAISFDRLAEMQAETPNSLITKLPADDIDRFYTPIGKKYSMVSRERSFRKFRPFFTTEGNITYPTTFLKEANTEAEGNVEITLVRDPIQDTVFAFLVTCKQIKAGEELLLKRMQPEINNDNLQKSKRLKTSNVPAPRVPKSQQARSSSSSKPSPRPASPPPLRPATPLGPQPQLSPPTLLPIRPSTADPFLRASPSPPKLVPITIFNPQLSKHDIPPSFDFSAIASSSQRPHTSTGILSFIQERSQRRSSGSSSCKSACQRPIEKAKGPVFAYHDMKRIKSLQQSKKMEDIQETDNLLEDLKSVGGKSVKTEVIGVVLYQWDMVASLSEIDNHEAVTGWKGSDLAELRSQIFQAEFGRRGKGRKHLAAELNMLKHILIRYSGCTRVFLMDDPDEERVDSVFGFIRSRLDFRNRGKVGGKKGLNPTRLNIHVVSIFTCQINGWVLLKNGDSFINLNQKFLDHFGNQTGSPGHIKVHHFDCNSRGTRLPSPCHGLSSFCSPPNPVILKRVQLQCLKLFPGQIGSKVGMQEILAANQGILKSIKQVAPRPPELETSIDLVKMAVERNDSYADLVGFSFSGWTSKMLVRVNMNALSEKDFTIITDEIRGISHHIFFLFDEKSNKDAFSTLQANFEIMSNCFSLEKLEENPTRITSTSTVEETLGSICREANQKQRKIILLTFTCDGIADPNGFRCGNRLSHYVSYSHIESIIRNNCQTIEQLILVCNHSMGIQENLDVSIGSCSENAIKASINQGLIATTYLCGPGEMLGFFTFDNVRYVCGLIALIKDLENEYKTEDLNGDITSSQLMILQEKLTYCQISGRVKQQHIEQSQDPLTGKISMGPKHCDKREAKSRFVNRACLETNVTGTRQTSNVNVIRDKERKVKKDNLVSQPLTSGSSDKENKGPGGGGALASPGVSATTNKSRRQAKLHAPLQSLIQDEDGDDIFSTKPKYTDDVLHEEARTIKQLLSVPPNMPELTTRDVAINFRMLATRGHPDDLVKVGKYRSIYHKTLEFMDDGKEVDATTVNVYLWLLGQRYQDWLQRKYVNEEAIMANIYSFSCEWVRDFMEGVEARLDIGIGNLWDYELLLFPVNFNNHWRLIVVNKTSRMVTSYSSDTKIKKSEEIQIIDKIIDLLNRMQPDLLDENSWMKNVSTNAPKQFDPSDCGVILLAIAEYISRGQENFNFNYTHVRYFRQKITKELYNFKVMS